MVRRSWYGKLVGLDLMAQQVPTRHAGGHLKSPNCWWAYGMVNSTICNPKYERALAGMEQNGLPSRVRSHAVWKRRRQSEGIAAASGMTEASEDDRRIWQRSGSGASSQEEPSSA
jgi:hypothetical protein